jgi:ribosomal protein S18 acetylase RimI-like enzyme
MWKIEPAIQSDIPALSSCGTQHLARSGRSPSDCCAKPSKVILTTNREATCGARWQRIIGWVLCKSMQNAGPEIARFQGRGGIGALCVHPDVQRRGVGTQLLDAAEAHLRAHGSALSTLYFPHHLLPGIPTECEAAIALFRKRGYTGFPRMRRFVARFSQLRDPGQSTRCD